MGDSLGNVYSGARQYRACHTMDDMIYHIQSVYVAATVKSLVIADMPFMAYATEVQAIGKMRPC